MLFFQIAQGAEPALLETSELKDFENLNEPRKKLIETAILAAKEVTGMPYLYDLAIFFIAIPIS